MARNALKIMFFKYATPNDTCMKLVAKTLLPLTIALMLISCGAADIGASVDPKISERVEK
jgi:hypothetical protein